MEGHLLRRLADRRYLPVGRRPDAPSQSTGAAIDKSKEKRDTTKIQALSDGLGRPLPSRSLAAKP